MSTSVLSLNALKLNYKTFPFFIIEDSFKTPFRISIFSIKFFYISPFPIYYKKTFTDFTKILNYFTFPLTFFTFFFLILVLLFNCNISSPSTSIAFYSFCSWFTFCSLTMFTFNFSLKIDFFCASNNWFN